MGAAAMDAHQRDVSVGVLLDDLVRDAHERAADVVLVEDDLLLGHSRPSWPLGTGLKGCAGEPSSGLGRLIWVSRNVRWRHVFGRARGAAAAAACDGLRIEQ